MTVPQTEQELKRLKDRILTQLFNNGIVQTKIKGVLYRNHIGHDTYLHEDLLQTVFEYLAKKSSQEIISMYYDDGRKPEGCLKRLTGLSVTIAVLKGVASNSNDKNYYKHSLCKYLLWGSNLQQLSSLSPTEHTDCEDGHQALVLVAPEDDDDGRKELWELIRSELTAAEIQDLDYFVNLKKKQGRYKSEIKAKYNHLLHRIEEIITHHKIHI